MQSERFSDLHRGFPCPRSLSFMTRDTKHESPSNLIPRSWVHVSHHVGRAIPICTLDTSCFVRGIKIRLTYGHPLTCHVISVNKYKQTNGGDFKLQVPKAKFLATTSPLTATSPSAATVPFVIAAIAGCVSQSGRTVWVRIYGSGFEGKCEEQAILLGPRMCKWQHLIGTLDA